MYAISGLRVVNARRGIGYVAPEAAVIHSRTSQATNTDFSRGSIAMPLYGPSNYPRLGLVTGGVGTANMQPSYYGVADKYGIEVPDWLGDVAGAIHNITGEIVGANPATADAPENTEYKDVGEPVKEGGLFGMDTKTLLLVGGGILAVWLLAKKG